MRARRVVEGEIAALAAAAGQRKHVQAMSRAIERMRETADRGVMPLDGDRAFHLAIAQACGNVVLFETVQGFWDSRRGPIFARLGGYFETVTSWRAAHRRARGRSATRSRAHDAEARAPRCTHTWTSPTPDSARAGAAPTHPDPPATPSHQPHDGDTPMTSKRLALKTLAACAHRGRRARRRSALAQAQTKLKWAHVYETSEPFHK